MTTTEITGILRLKGGEKFSQDLQNRLGRAKKAFASVNNAIAATGMVLTLRKWNEEANKATNAMLGLQSVAKFKGILGAQSAVQDLTAVKEGMLSANDAALGLKNLLSRGYDLKSAIGTLERLSEAAAFNRSSHLSLGEAIKTASEGLKNENSILVDNAGVTKNVSVMWKEYADSIGVSATQLTQQQKIQAEINGIMKETEAQVGDLAKLSKSEAGNQARLAAANQRVAVSFGRIYQVLAGPFITIITKVFDTIADAPRRVQNLVAALGVMSVSLKIFAGAIQALWPALGPVGWIITGVSLLATAFGALELATNRSKKKLAEFNSELAGLSLIETEEKLANIEQKIINITEEREKWNKFKPRSREEAFAGSISKKQLNDEMALLKQQKESLLNHIKELKDIREGKEKDDAAARNQELELEKELMDNKMRYESETAKISLYEFNEYLKKRKNDYEAWSTEWLALHKEIQENELLLAKETAEKKSEIEGEFIDKRYEVNEALKRAEDERIAREKQEADEMLWLWNDAFFKLGGAIRDWNEDFDVEAYRRPLRQLLIALIDFLERKYILAKLDALIEAVINPFATIRKAGLLLAAAAAFEAAKGAIAAYANGGIIMRPTLALVGEAGPEVIAPKRDFIDYSRQLMVEAAAGTTFNQGGVKIFQQFNTPLNDRRQARRLKEEALMPELKRERKRAGRFLNQKI